ncbi:MAG: PspC domain-containing protein [Nocardioides sp.]
MTTTPGSTEAPSGAPDPDEGPRVSRDEVRDLGRLRRSSHDRKVAGVAGGIARHLDIDPVIMRVAFVVLAFFGGAGLLLYGVCWLLVPEDGSPDATVRLDERSRTVALVIVGGLAALLLIGDSWGGWGFPWPLAIIAVIVLLVMNNRGRSQPPPPGPVAAPGTTYPPTGYQSVPPAAPRNPRRRGPRLFWFSLALAALGIGILGIVDLAGLDVAHSAYPALVLAVSGVMLVVGAFYGRAGGLILLGLVAALATAGATAAHETDAGPIVETPRTAASVQSTYDLGVGEIQLDLTEVADLDNLDGRTIRLEATFGRIEVILPAGVDVDVNADVEAAGTTRLFGSSEDRSDTAQLDGGTDVPAITIDAEVTFGEIEVNTDGRINR